MESVNTTSYYGELLLTLVHCFKPPKPKHFAKQHVTKKNNLQSPEQNVISLHMPVLLSQTNISPTEHECSYCW